MLSQQVCCFTMFSSNSGIFTQLSYYTYITDEDISPLSKVGHSFDISMRAIQFEVEGIDYTEETSCQINSLAYLNITRIHNMFNIVSSGKYITICTGIETLVT